ncbi:hypothetical protein HN682_00965 [Candidatus Peregrinibacteria bacterium]|jgi:hypothetical protein|nr:hypothetical protein [Candidatus Peregrinibacteria bacterium]
MIYIGLDNGVSGSIGIVKDNGRYNFYKVPCFVEQNYTKAKGNISRIDHKAFHKLLKPYSKKTCKIFLERPMVNPGRFKATVSALRALESCLIVVETLGIPHEYIDSKEWQKAILPKGVSGDELKKASLDIGCRLFPKRKTRITSHKDADGILIAEYARRVKK